ncbi:MAG: DUF2264 domain-containing protein [Planctomycetia bacterium]
MADPAGSSPSRCARAPGGTLATRADVEGLLLRLLAPLEARRSPGGARLDLPPPARAFPADVAGLEGFARPLWGLAAHAAGGGHHPAWEAVRRGLAAGSDPAHPEWWGRPGDADQRLVEMGTLGAALLLAPHEMWAPLAPAVQQRLAAWLAGAQQARPHDNNWHWFGVLAGLGLARVGRAHDVRAQRRALEAIESRALAGGWYDDRPREPGCAQRRVDGYTPFAFHLYGLLYAASGLGDAARAERLRARARTFAQGYRHWFDADGATLVHGRSLAYRWAPAAFWGALALANEEALPWGELKGLYLRHLRWWAAQPVLDAQGLLLRGHARELPEACEHYISGASPLWALKAFLPLALPATHPFWASAEAVPAAPGGPWADPVARMVLAQDGEQVLALCGGQDSPGFVTQAPAKYARLALSSRMGLALDVPGRTPGEPPWLGESTLVARDAAGEVRRLADPEQPRVVGSRVARRWRPWPDVVVETVLEGQPPWHVRLHHVETARPLVLEEWGFALPEGGAGLQAEVAGGEARLSAPQGASWLLDLGGTRTAGGGREVERAHLQHERVALPFLRAQLAAGEHTLACAVLGAGPREAAAAAAGAVPAALAEPGASTARAARNVEVSEGLRALLAERVRERRAGPAAGLAVGVVIAVRNRPTLVLEALASVAAQQRAPQRVVVVDDGSTDGTPAAVRAWLAAQGRPGWELLERAHAGAAAARNAGMAQVGDVDAFAFLDSDDLWPPDFLGRACAVLAADGRCVVATCDRRTLDVQAGREQLDRLAALVRDPMGWMVVQGAGFGSCSLLRAGAVRAAGGWPERLPTGHDGVLFAHLARLGRWAHVPGAACSMRRHHAGARGEAGHIYLQVRASTLRWARNYEEVLREEPWRVRLRPVVRAGMARRWVRASKESRRAGQPWRAWVFLGRALRWNPLYPQAWRQALKAARALRRHRRGLRKAQRGGG